MIARLRPLWLVLSLLAACHGRSRSLPGSAAAGPDAGPRSASPAVVPPEREAEIAQLLGRRESLIRKCYQDVLNEKHDRAFRGSVRMVIALDRAGHAREVRVAGGTLADQEVTACLVETLKGFAYPALPQPGEVQYQFDFRPTE